LDGETNLKHKTVPKALRKILDDEYEVFFFVLSLYSDEKNRYQNGLRKA
jgi:hypothetical protein